VNAKSSSQLSKQAEELLEVVHQFRLWEEEEEREETEHSLAALPQPYESDESEGSSENATERFS